MGRSQIIRDVVEKAEIILEVLDARLIDETRNSGLENRIEKQGKQVIFVINKCDLVDKQLLESKKKEFKHAVYVSSNKRLGTTMLREKILSLSKGKPVVVGVVGYPNVGKSSVINALAGRKKAMTSITSGQTRGVQIIKADNKIKLLDTPGEFPFDTTDEFVLAFVGSIDFNRVKDPEDVVLKLLEKYGSVLAKYYGVDLISDTDDFLDELARKYNMLKKGAVPNTRRMAVRILQDWQKGKIRL